MLTRVGVELAWGRVCAHAVSWLVGVERWQRRREGLSAVLLAQVAQARHRRGLDQRRPILHCTHHTTTSVPPLTSSFFQAATKPSFEDHHIPRQHHKCSQASFKTGWHGVQVKPEEGQSLRWSWLPNQSPCGRFMAARLEADAERWPMPVSWPLGRL